jgi:two-component system sensor histidine kinase HydH
MVLLAAFILTLLLLWHALSSYRQATPVAEGNLRGVALSLAAVMEGVANRHASLDGLSEVKARDIAFATVIDRQGGVAYHSNRALIGTRVSDNRFQSVFSQQEIHEARVLLGTGEIIYEFNAPFHLNGETFALRLALHTYQADLIIRRARLHEALLLAITGLAWLLGIALYRLMQKEHERQRELSRRQRFAELGEMGAALAHEIRNPLSSIKGYSQLLQESAQSPTDCESISLIVSEAERLEKLVNDLLDYTRLGGRNDEGVELLSVIQRSLLLLAGDREGEKFIVTTSVPPGLLVTCPADRLQQLLLNLLANARQAMPNGGEINLSARRVRNAVEMIVFDRGCGIPPEVLSRIFTPFFTTKARGTGLGLAICRKIVEECDGSISISSKPQEGTTVTVTLPLAAKGSRA